MNSSPLVLSLIFPLGLHLILASAYTFQFFPQLGHLTFCNFSFSICSSSSSFFRITSSFVKSWVNSQTCLLALVKFTNGNAITSESCSVVGISAESDYWGLHCFYFEILAFFVSCHLHTYALELASTESSAGMM